MVSVAVSSAPSVIFVFLIFSPGPARAFPPPFSAIGQAHSLLNHPRPCVEARELCVPRAQAGTRGQQR
jgi:hypothetical protein